MKNIQFISVRMSELISSEFERVLKKHLKTEKGKEFLTREDASKMLSLSYSGLYKLVIYHSKYCPKVEIAHSSKRAIKG